MNNPNHHIILDIANSLLKQFEEGSEEFEDINRNLERNNERKLAEIILNVFPWPIAISLRRVFSSLNRDNDRKQLLIKLSEGALQFFSYVLLSQLWEEKKKSHIELTKDFKDQFQKFGKFSFGTYSGLIRSIQKVFVINNITPFTDHFDDILYSNKAFMKLAEQFVEIRNAEAHFASDISCDDLEEMIKKLISSLSFLVKYKLVSISNIEVIKPRLADPRFRHLFRVTESSDDPLNSIEHEYDIFSESNSVILLKDFTTPRQYLNLSPFLIDTENRLKNASVDGILKGVYMYAYIQNGNYNYIFLRSKKTSCLNSLPDFSQIEKEFSDLKRTLEYEEPV